MSRQFDNFFKTDAKRWRSPNLKLLMVINTAGLVQVGHSI